MSPGRIRRNLKWRGPASVRAHYRVFAFVCLIASFIGAEYANSLGFLSYGREHLTAISDFFNHFGRPGFAASSRGVLALAVRGLSKGSITALIEDALFSLLSANRALEIAGIVGNTLVALCVGLLACYGADMAYSHEHPNTGAGITDYASSNLDEFTAGEANPGAPVEVAVGGLDAGEEAA